MWKTKKKIGYWLFLLVGLSNLLFFFGYFLNGFFQFNLLKISIYTGIIASWNFLLFVTIIVIGRIGRKKSKGIIITEPILRKGGDVE